MERAAAARQLQCEGQRREQRRVEIADRHERADAVVHGASVQKPQRIFGCREKADGFCDGTFMHAWLPDIFTDAEIREVRGGKVMHVTKFTAENEKAVKDFAWGVLLDRKAYK